MEYKKILRNIALGSSLALTVLSTPACMTNVKSVDYYVNEQCSKYESGFVINPSLENYFSDMLTKSGKYYLVQNPQIKKCNITRWMVDNPDLAKKVYELWSIGYKKNYPKENIESFEEFYERNSSIFAEVGKKAIKARNKDMEKREIEEQFKDFKPFGSF